MPNIYIRYAGHAGICLFLLGSAIQADPVLPILCLAASAIIMVWNLELRSDFRGVFFSMASMAIFTVFFGLSILASENIERSIFYSSPVIFGLMLYLLAIWVFKKGDCYAVFIYLSLAALLMSLILFWSAIIYPDISEKTDLVRLSQIPALVTRNDLSLLSVISPVSFAIIFYPMRHWIIPMLGFLSIFLSGICMVIYQSRGASLSLVIGCAAAALIIGGRKFILWLAVPIAAMVITDAAQGFNFLTRYQSALGGIDGSLLLRGQHWKTAWSMFLSAPWLGHGPHTFGLYDPIPWAHNLYMEMLAEQGLFGLLTLLAVLFSSVIQLWSLRNADREIKILAAGIAGSMLCFAAAAIIELSFLRMWVVVMFYLFTGLSAALCLDYRNAILRHREKTPVSS